MNGAARDWVHGRRAGRGDESVSHLVLRVRSLRVRSVSHHLALAVPGAARLSLAPFATPRAVPRRAVSPSRGRAAMPRVGARNGVLRVQLRKVWHTSPLCGASTLCAQQSADGGGLSIQCG